jgi:hypothetical protein
MAGSIDRTGWRCWHCYALSKKRQPMQQPGSVATPGSCHPTRAIMAQTNRTALGALPPHSYEFLLLLPYDYWQYFGW